MGIIGMILAMLWGAVGWAIGMASMVIGMLGFWALSILGISYLIYKVVGNKPAERAESSKPELLRVPPQKDKLTCPYCGQRLYEDDVICPGCYRDLQINCPCCGEIIEIHWDFCPRCGKAI